MSHAASAMTRPTPPATRSVRVAGSLLLAGAGLVLGLLAGLPWLAHHHASDWPVVTAALESRTVVTRYSNRNGPSYVVRDSYRLPAAGGPTQCHWDDPLGTGIRRWIDARLETRNVYWPAGSQVAVYAEPYGDRCEPLGGYERAVRPTLLVVALAALACLGGLAYLWRPQAKVD